MSRPSREEEYTDPESSEAYSNGDDGEYSESSYSEEGGNDETKEAEKELGDETIATKIKIPANRCRGCFGCKLGKRCVGDPTKSCSKKYYPALRALLKREQKARGVKLATMNNTPGRKPNISVFCKRKKTSEEDGPPKRRVKAKKARSESDESGIENAKQPQTKKNRVEESSSSDESESDDEFSKKRHAREAQLPATRPRNCDLVDQVKILKIQLVSSSEAMENERLKRLDENNKAQAEIKRLKKQIEVLEKEKQEMRKCEKENQELRKEIQELRKSGGKVEGGVIYRAASDDMFLELL